MLTVREVAEKYELTFENALAGIAREELIFCVSKVCDILINAPDNLGVESYKKGADKKIRAAYIKKDNISPKEFVGKLIRDVSGNYPESRVEILGEIAADGGLRFDVLVEGMRVPFRLSLFPIDVGAYLPVRREAILLRSDQKFIYLHFPVEAEVASDIFKIIEDLELIGDMGIYDRVYNNIVSLPLEGKLVWSRLNELLEKKDRKEYLNRIAIISSYKENIYMNKKWDKYIKRHILKGEAFKKTITSIEIFVSPIWEALKEDRPFIGDWMPELGRFL